ncbi:hypothetical protein ACIGMX_12635 [Streptomyces aquilus]|uniref:hypothetical protein n=1 Tax=Streptomyces aquilus TaxID=2548456 RepID=UPI0037D706DD
MPFLPASAAEPRHTRGGAGAAGRGQWVRYPLRLVLDADAYADADTKVYGKVRALAKGRPCTASLDKLADFCGLTVSTVEKSLGRLSRPASTDSVIELTRRQRSHPGTGTGRTTERTYRALDDGERYVSAPVLAADTLRGTLHRLYLLVRYTTLVEKRQLTLAEMAWALRHHSGKTAGQPLAEAAVTRLLEQLDEAGWITLDKRAGYRGRHLITVHDDPVHPACEPEATPDPEGGAAPDLEGGALAYKEDHPSLNDLGSTEGRGSSAVGEVTVSVCPPVDNSAAPSVAATFRPAVRPTGRPAYAGPQLTVSPRVAAVLEPVADLLADVRPFVARRIARVIGEQLDAGIWAEDIRDQLTRMRAWTSAEELHDPGRWLLGAVLPARSACERPDCYWGFQHYTGAPCKECAEITAARARAAHPPHTPAWHECRDCRAPSRHHLPAGLCAACRPTA